MKSGNVYDLSWVAPACVFGFQSTATVEQLIQDLKNLMHSLPNYSSQFLEMVCKMLTIFKDSCDETYKGGCVLFSSVFYVQPWS